MTVYHHTHKTATITEIEVRLTFGASNFESFFLSQNSYAAHAAPAARTGISPRRLRASVQSNGTLLIMGDAVSPTSLPETLLRLPAGVWDSVCINSVQVGRSDPDHDCIRSEEVDPGDLWPYVL